MSDIPVTVTFQVEESKVPDFLEWLRKATDDCPSVHGLRSGEGNRLPWREALRIFAGEMERVLKAHDHKTDWRLRPVKALISKMYLEVEEFKVAVEHFEVKEARNELIDIANFCMIVSDRLSMYEQDKTLGEQSD